MTTDTLTLTAFLLARIGEDEAYAREPDGWNEYNPGDPSDPDRILAECKAKRMIVELSASWVSQADRAVGHDASLVMLKTQAITSATILRQLASVYADHPDFSPDWV